MPEHWETMAYYIINPGSGPVSSASEQDAVANIKVFVAELGIPAVVTKSKKDSGEDGRFAFALTCGDRSIEVLIPGIALDRVRYVDGPTQNILSFPRLYVDGNSWLWMYALDIARETLTGE